MIFQFFLSSFFFFFFFPSNKLKFYPWHISRKLCNVIVMQSVPGHNLTYILHNVDIFYVYSLNIWMHFSCIPSLYIITRLDNVMNINEQYMRMMFIRRMDGNGLLCRSFRKKKKKSSAFGWNVAQSFFARKVNLITVRWSNRIRNWSKRTYVEHI